MGLGRFARIRKSRKGENVQLDRMLSIYMLKISLKLKLVKLLGQLRTKIKAYCFGYNYIE